VGTGAVSVTRHDIDGDGVPDMLVADQGSGDNAVLFRSWDNTGGWVARPGPRLKCGGSGPIGVTLRDMTGDGIPHLVVTNGQSGTMAILPGVGQGFFNDQNPQILTIPGNPVIAQPPAFVGSSGSGVVVTAAGQLIGLNLD